jgi:glycyl-tRNA synthetase beta subunit
VSSSETTKIAELLSYISIRFEQQLLEEGIPQWIAHNVALGTSGDIAKKHEYAKKLAQLASTEETKYTLIETFKRVTNILDKNSTETLKVSTTMLIEPADTALASFIQQHQQAFMPQDILEIASLLHTFFESVMVMDPDLEIRNARIGMLNTIRSSLREYFAISFT